LENRPSVGFRFIENQLVLVSVSVSRRALIYMAILNTQLTFSLQGLSLLSINISQLSIYPNINSWTFNKDEHSNGTVFHGSRSLSLPHTHPHTISLSLSLFFLFPLLFPSFLTPFPFPFLHFLLRLLTRLADIRGPLLCKPSRERER
jgi:hypothetical protein